VLDGTTVVHATFTSFEDSAPVVEQPAVSDEDGINENPDTGSSEGEGLEGTDNKVTHVESVNTEVGSEGKSQSGGGGVGEDGGLLNVGPGGTNGGNGTNESEGNGRFEHNCLHRCWSRTS